VPQQQQQEDVTVMADTCRADKHWLNSKPKQPDNWTKWEEVWHEVVRILATPCKISASQMTLPRWTLSPKLSMFWQLSRKDFATSLQLDEQLDWHVLKINPVILGRNGFDSNGCRQK